MTSNSVASFPSAKSETHYLFSFFEHTSVTFNLARPSLSSLLTSSSQHESVKKSSLEQMSNSRVWSQTGLSPPSYNVVVYFLVSLYSTSINGSIFPKASVSLWITPLTMVINSFPIEFKGYISGFKFYYALNPRCCNTICTSVLTQILFLFSSSPSLSSDRVF